MKRDVDALAVFGGSPSFDPPLHVGRPQVGDRDRMISYLEEILTSRQLTNQGRYVSELEGRLADYLSVKHCITTCNGTTALQIAARAAGLSGSVIVPAFSFVASAHALAWLGLEPVLCDVDPSSCTIDPLQADALVDQRVSAILGVHLWGRPCDVDGLSRIAQQHSLKLIFDAAQAFGCTHGGVMVGGFGDAEALSFHATKVFNTFEGGAVTTNDDQLAARARLATNFGFTDYDRISALGTNGKMTEVAAAMGLVSLASLPEFIESNRRNYLAYREGVAEIAAVSLLEHDEHERRNFQNVVIRFEPTARLSRDTAHRVLWAEGVRARRYFHPGLHKVEPYRSTPSISNRSFPATNRLAATTLALPSGGELTPETVGQVCDLVSLIMAEAESIEQMLDEREAAV